MLRLFIIGLLMLMPMTAFSQPPSPTPTKTIEKPDTNTENKKHKAQITTPLRASMSHEQTAIPPDDKHEDKASPDWWLVWLTGGMVLVTGILAVYTARLWKTTKHSLDITKKSVDLARQEFISAHRPRLIIRNVTIKPYHPLSSVPIEDGKPIMIEWSVVNVGETTAEIIASNATAFLDVHPFEARTEYSKERNTMGNNKIIPGNSSIYCFTADDIVFPNYGSFSQRIVQRERVIYFIGFIEYKDAIGTVRRTAFCRGYNPTTERFVVVNDPDYEYTD